MHGDKGRKFLGQPNSRQILKDSVKLGSLLGMTDSVFVTRYTFRLGLRCKYVFNEAESTVIYSSLY